MACNGCIRHGTPIASHGDLLCAVDGGYCVSLWQGSCSRETVELCGGRTHAPEWPSGFSPRRRTLMIVSME
jgi:hypothetical protein